MLKTHLFSRYYFIDCFAEYEQRTLYGALVATLATLLRLVNCRLLLLLLLLLLYRTQSVGGMNKTEETLKQ